MVREIAAGEHLPVRRGQVVVCLVAFVADADPALPGDVTVVACGERLSPADAVRAADPADVLLLHAGATVPTGWLDQLRAAGGAEAGVATLSALATAAGAGAAELAAAAAVAQESVAGGAATPRAP